MRSYVVSPIAAADLEELLHWTDRHFGDQARLRYEALIWQAIVDVRCGRGDSDSAFSESLGNDLRVYHLSRSRDRVAKKIGRVKQPRHFLIYRLRAGSIVEIVRILHDAADLNQHVSDE